MDANDRKIGVAKGGHGKRQRPRRYRSSEGSADGVGAKRVSGSPANLKRSDSRDSDLVSSEFSSEELIMSIVEQRASLVKTTGEDDNNNSNDIEAAQEPRASRPSCDKRVLAYAMNDSSKTNDNESTKRLFGGDSDDDATPPAPRPPRFRAPR